MLCGGSILTRTIFSNKVRQVSRRRACFTCIRHEDCRRHSRFCAPPTRWSHIKNLAADYSKKNAPAKGVGITGSNGKTSRTKLSRHRSGTFRAEGNFNNHVALLLVCIWRQIAIISSRFGNSAWVSGDRRARPHRLARCRNGITNIGIAHIEFMGDRGNRAEKRAGGMIDPDGFVVLEMADDDFSGSIANRTRARVIFAGIEEHSRDSKCTANASGCEFTIVEGAHRCRAQLPVSAGSHMVQNAILAVAAGRAFGVSLGGCAAGLVSAPLAEARLQIRECTVSSSSTILQRDLIP